MSRMVDPIAIQDSQVTHSEDSAPQVELNLDLLSSREKQVLSLAALGFIDKQIGQQLNISLNTLRTYWRRIREKSGEAPRAALAAAFVAEEFNELEGTGRGQFLHEGWVYDVKTGLMLASDTLNRIHGLEPGHLYPREAYLPHFQEQDTAVGVASMDEVISGRVETASFVLRTRKGETIEPVLITIYGVRDQEDKVAKVIGFRSKLKHWSFDGKSSDRERVQVGFWAKNLQEHRFITPDEEFCRIYAVNRDSPTLDRDIRSRYTDEDRHRAYDFIEQAAQAGETRGSRDFHIVLNDGSRRWIRLEFYIESDEQGPTRANGTVLAFR